MEDFSYQDIVDLPHPVSKRHRPMPLRARAAQFAPFAALTGYAALIAETARVPEERRELSEAARSQLDTRLRVLGEHLPEQPEVEIEHFVPDATKLGGCHVRTVGHLAKVLPSEGQLVLADGTVIAFADIVAIESGLLDNFDFME